VSDRVRNLLQSWHRRIREDSLPPLTVVYGKSEPLVRKSVELLLEHCFAQGGRGLNHHTFDARSSRPSEWLVAARTAPMMAAHRVVVVTDAEVCFKSDGGLDDDAVAALVSFAAGGARKGRVVMTARAVDKRSSLAKALVERQALFEFEIFQRDNEVHDFIRDAFRKRGISVDGGAVAFLADALGRSADAIITEVDKLTEYAGETRAISRADAEEMVQRLREHNLFDLNRALMQRDTMRVLTILDRMFNNLVATRKKVAASALPLLILSTCIEGEFRKLAIAKGFEDANDAQGLARRLNLRETVAGIILSNARRITDKEIAAALSGVRSVDKRLKSTSLAPRLLLEELCLSICRGEER